MTEQAAGDRGSLDDQIRRAVERTADLLREPPERPRRDSAEPPPIETRMDYRKLDSAEAEVEQAVRRLDQPLPSPPTVRGRFGGIAIDFLRKALWWQTHQLKNIFEALTRRGREGRCLLERLGTLVQRLDQRLSQLEAAQLEVRSDAIDLARVEEVKSLESQLSRLNESLEDLRGSFGASSGRVEEVAAGLGRVQATAELVEQQRLRLEALERQIEETKQPAAEAAMRGELQRQAEELAAVASRLQQFGGYAHHTRSQTSLLDRRITTLIEAVRRSAGDDDWRQSLLKSDAAVGREDLEYHDFERAFRGTRDEIKERQRVYLPLLEQAGLGSPETPVLDLGCGRGEWLELLREKGLEASGVDRNQEMLAECRRRDLRVEQADALEFLRAAPDSSLGAVTGFHIVEHLPYETLVALIDEAVRTLRPGGLAIFETPNPGNILVATQGFYLDPTHIRPLPSPLLRYLVEARGLCDVYCKELNPDAEWAALEDGSDSLAERFNRLVYGPRDYAVIGRKA